jgi:hypothetical protein
MSLSVFISHRHADKGLAEAILYHLTLWGLRGEDIHLSSDFMSEPGASRLRQNNLTKALWVTSLLLLVYTVEDEDWSYCMWEAGVASSPDSPDTNLVIFQCGSESPLPFSPELKVSLSEDSVSKFVSEFLRAPNFIPGQPPIKPDVAAVDVAYFTRRLLDDLKKNGAYVVDAPSAPVREVAGREEPRAESQPRPIFDSPASKGSDADVFMLMPFAEEMRQIFEDYVKKVAAEMGLKAARGDDYFSPGVVANQISDAIYNAKIVVADCTGGNSNVFYEVGMAHGRDKTTVLITQSLNDIPFDLRHYRIIEYKYTPPGMVKFEQDLRKTFQSILGHNAQ